MVLSLAALWAWVAAAAGAASEPVRYTLDLRKPASHFAQVTMTIPAAAPQTEIQFPAWNNLYQIRDFVRSVHAVKAACNGSRTKLSRRDRNTWLSAKACANLEIRYTVRANEESPFSSAVNEQHAFLNFAMLLFYLPEERPRALRVKFLLPPGWKLAALLESADDEIAAANYDELVDSPAEAGQFQDFQYQQNGATYRVVVHSEAPDFSSERLLASLEKITATETALMHDDPFTRYTFILHFLPRGWGGGMEHRNGAAVSAPGRTVANRWPDIEATLAHEFFHAWNVKRIRPMGLEPVDYERATDTSELWFSEGVTSTYQELTLVRGGMISRPVFYQHMAHEIGLLQARPARLRQSVEQSGREAWLEKYRAYYRPARSISYYNKGELVGFLLDLGIRHASRGRHSLDDVMRRLNQDFAQRGRFFTQADLRAIIRDLAPEFADLDGFFRAYISGTRELDYSAFLAFAGLRLLADPQGPHGRTAYRVEEIPGASAEQVKIREGWLTGNAE